MKVIKSDGRYQDFDIEKIRTVLARVSDECGASLNTGDINAVCAHIQHAVYRLESAVPHDVLYDIVSGALRKFGFSGIADAFVRGIDQQGPQA